MLHRVEVPRAAYAYLNVIVDEYGTVGSRHRADSPKKVRRRYDESGRALHGLHNHGGNPMFGEHSLKSREDINNRYTAVRVRIRQAYNLTDPRLAAVLLLVEQSVVRYTGRVIGRAMERSVERDDDVG